VQHAWAAGADQVLCDPSGGCKLIFPRQWTEAMRVASSLYAGHQGIKSLGAPDAVAHPSGRAGLCWRKDSAWLTLLLDEGSSALAFSGTWERSDARGALSGESRDLQDLAAAIASLQPRAA
jgi:hypothetical protein